MSVTTTNGNTALMSFIERAANNPEFDVAKFSELLRLQRDVSHDQARRAFNAAMADAQSEMLPVVRDAKNSHLNNRYARLETIDAAMRPIYTRHGFSVRYGSAPSSSEGMIRITCTVAHADGYFEEQYLDAPTVNAGSQGGRTATTPVQAVGSAITYLRRYLLSMVFNVVLADDDDDGEGMRRAAAAPMARADRIAEKAPAYEAPPPQPKQTIGQFLDALEIAVRDCDSLAAVNRINASPKVVQARQSLKNGALERLESIIASGLAAHAPITYPTDDDGDAASEDLEEVQIAGAEKLASGD